MNAFVNCVTACLKTYLSALGPFTMAAIILCLILGGVAPGATLVCLVGAGVTAFAAGVITCIACC
jgi:hypothetical protein